MFSKCNVGDKVFDELNDKGHISSKTSGMIYPIKVTFKNGYRSYTMDGRLYTTHTKPSLFLKKQPLKGQEKVKVKYWVNIYPTYRTQSAWKSRKEALQNKNVDCIRTIKVKGSYIS